MKMNRVETALVINPLRALLQRRLEAPLLERLGGRVDRGKVLEIGCGSGVGVEIILEQFGANVVHAFDLDPAMVARARRRLESYSPDRLQLGVGSATQILEEDASFDAVFDFGVIHHVVDWRKAISEVARVLRPGGSFFFEEVTRRALERWSYRTFLDHPIEDRFSGAEFRAELEEQGILVGDKFVHRLFGDLILGVGRREHLQG